MMTPELNKQVARLSDAERDGVEAIVNSMMELIEPVIRQRCTQWLKFIQETQQASRSASPQINAAKESCGGVPPFFKDILRKLEFSAQQSELWEEPEDVSTVAVEYRALAGKLERWIDQQTKGS